MSVRAERKTYLETLEDRIASKLRVETEAREERIALEHYRDDMSADPRKPTLCELEIEYAPISTMVDRAFCSECRQGVIGWNERWRYCPLCGSQIEKATREESSFERQVRESATRIYNGVNKHHVAS